MTVRTSLLLFPINNTFAAPSTPCTLYVLASLASFTRFGSTGLSAKTITFDIASSYADASVVTSMAGDATRTSSSIAAQCTKPANTNILAGHLFIGP
jgi:hypothetical protein